MFLYFIEKKNFLDNNPNYLRYNLEQKVDGKRKTGTYYQDFLIPLFHEGLGQTIRSVKIENLVGKIPYLNGGLFQVHLLEQKYPKIQISDEAFARIFDFFDMYQWHLDDRPIRADNEINPDVLGYIFEKYVNQRELGAYYSKQDITDYISKNTILPFLLLQLNAILSDKDNESLWQLLKDFPERYIYATMQKGFTRKDGSLTPLPEKIASGLNNPDKREQWNFLADTEYGLPTETWADFLQRRMHYLNIKEVLSRGKIQSPADLITFNLDIRQFLQDAIENTNSPLFLQEFWSVLNKITILDPTCGSGAFLFESLNVLEPLYESCLDQMERMIEDYGTSKSKEVSSILRYFSTILNRVEEHPNRKYFSLKSIMLNNLFGVDIMEEAVEICKLRMFLKLAAQVEADFSKNNYGLEPLPDIDFNIRVGNSLIGFIDLNQVKNALTSGQQKFGNDKILKSIEEKAKLCDDAFDAFRQQQINHKSDNEALLTAKRNLTEKLHRLNLELDKYLALDYKINIDRDKSFEKWHQDYKPFHWFLEFYGIIQKGGFDVIIGNPPYLEIQQVNYIPLGFTTTETRAIHAMCIERCHSILQQSGCISMIVPMSLVSTQRMQIVRQIIEEGYNIWYSNYAWRPAKLFDNVNRALTIFVAIPANEPQSFSTNYQKWNSENREFLFQTIKYTIVPRNQALYWCPKLGDEIELEILNKCQEIHTTLENFIAETDYRIYYRTTGGLYWKVFTDFSPLFKLNGKRGHSTRETSISLRKLSYVRPIIAVLSSDIFWWWYTISTTCRDLNPTDIKSFPIPEAILEDPSLSKIAIKYLKDLEKNSSILIRHQKQTGKTETQSFKIQKSKAIIDEIDCLLSRYYKLTSEELNFIINYDIKYRMGVDNENNSENE